MILIVFLIHNHRNVTTTHAHCRSQCITGVCFCRHCMGLTILEHNYFRIAIMMIYSHRYIVATSTHPSEKSWTLIMLLWWGASMIGMIYYSIRILTLINLMVFNHHWSMTTTHSSCSGQCRTLIMFFWWMTLMVRVIHPSFFNHHFWLQFWGKIIGR